MSNLIKGYSISYNQETFKPLDFTKSEKKIAETVHELLREQQTQEGFTEGIGAPKISSPTYFDDLQKNEELGNSKNKIYVMTSGEYETLKNSLKLEIRTEVRKEVEIELRTQMLAEVQAMHKQAEDEAVALKADVIAQGQKEIEDIKASVMATASREAYDEGMKQVEEERESARESLIVEKEKLETKYAAKIAELEPQFVEVLKAYLKKITGRSYEKSTSVLTYLIDTGIRNLPKDTEFSVHLCPEDYERLSHEIDDIKMKYSDNLSLEFVKDDSLAAGDVRLVNDLRIVDCGLNVTLDGLLEALDLIS